MTNLRNIWISYLVERVKVEANNHYIRISKYYKLHEGVMWYLIVTIFAITINSTTFINDW